MAGPVAPNIAERASKVNHNLKLAHPQFSLLFPDGLNNPSPRLHQLVLVKLTKDL